MSINDEGGRQGGATLILFAENLAHKFSIANGMFVLCLHIGTMEALLRMSHNTFILL